MDIEATRQADDPDLPPVRWEPCEAFATVDHREVCDTCGWLAEDHLDPIAAIVTFPAARPARVRRAS